MNPLETKQINCPYCAENIEILIDCSVEFQQYTEDCQVCCCPINLTVTCSFAGDLTIEAHHENE